jgi:hypothetical protein
VRGTGDRPEPAVFATGSPAGFVACTTLAQRSLRISCS